MTTAAALALLAAPAVAQTQSSPPPAGIGAPPPSAGAASPQHSDTTTAPRAPQLSDQDRHFLEEATAGGQAEVTLGRLAAQKAKDPAVKDFGQKMVQDHTKANQQLSGVLSQAGITPPPANDQMLRADQAKLEKLKGAAFDRAYMRMMLKDHRHDVQLFQQEEASENPALKRFASDTLPILRNHLNMAEAIEKNMRSGGVAQGSGAGAASASGSSVTKGASQGAALSLDRTMQRPRAIHHAEPSDHEADRLNRQELRQLQGG
jgi:putative membrane protein